MRKLRGTPTPGVLQKESASPRKERKRVRKRAARATKRQQLAVNKRVEGKRATERRWWSWDRGSKAKKQGATQIVLKITGLRE
jgi:hypothetical protein